MFQGQLKSWNEERGFGFISSSQIDNDVFLHISSLKHMQRSPKQGDIIFFEVTKQSNGKLSATNCRIQGVPYKQSKTNRSNKGGLSKLLPIAIVLIAVFIYQKVNPTPEIIESETNRTELTPFALPKYNFTCQGKQHCSQMTSCEEAEFYIANCPNTKMDGDGDGIPCERQWCG